MKLFVYKEGELKLYREEILLHGELNAILSRDKGSPGDSDGRKKLQAWKEFKYLYMICDYYSYPNQKGMSERDSHKYAVDISDLPETWLPDKILLTAMDFYVEANLSVARELNKELQASFKNSSRVVRKLRGETEKLLDKSILTPIEIEQLNNMQANLLDISTKLPKQLKSLQESADLIKKEEQEGEIARGGDSVLDSQDPDRSL